MTATILVHIGDFEWTMKAMHLACAMAHNTQSNLVLLQLRAVSNPALLGSGLGVDLPSSYEDNNLRKYLAVAEDYGVTFTLQPMAYVSRIDALIQAASEIDAVVVFTHFPKRILPLWDRLQQWSLRRQLAAQGCQLYTLSPSEQPEKRVQVAATRHA